MRKTREGSATRPTAMRLKKNAGDWPMEKLRVSGSILLGRIVLGREATPLKGTTSGGGREEEKKREEGP